MIILTSKNNPRRISWWKNHFANLRQTLCSRLLYTVVPAPYSQDTLNDLLVAWVNDLNGLSQHGLTVPKLNWLILVLLNYMCSCSFVRVVSPFDPLCLFDTNLSFPHFDQVLWKGRVLKFRFVVISIKGDWPFLRSSCGLNNGYNCKDKCHRCPLGDLWNQFSNFDVKF